jgi:tetratricopeptide (TPR) repeat protein
VRAAISLILVVALVVPPLAPVARAQTTEADVYVQQAVLDFDDKRFDSALDNLRRALEIEADHVEALYYMGVVHMARRRPGEAVPFLLRARQRSPSDPSVAFQLGLAYFAQQDYDQAVPLLEQVFTSNPTLDGLGYYVGFIRYRKKDYRGALAAFRAGRASDPDIQQLTRFYAGLSLAILGQPAQAIAEVEQAMRLAPGSPLTAPAERLRDTIVTARARERRLSAELRLGGFFDDNVAVVPDRDTREPLVPELRQAARESTGEFVALRLDYSWLKHFVDTELWDSTVGYSFFGTYNNDLPDFNVTNHLLTAGVTRRGAIGSMPAQAGAQYAWDVLFLNDDEFIQRNSATLFAALVESDLHLTQVFGRWQHKQYNRTPDTPRREFRDGDNYMAGFLHLLRFSQDAHFIKVGYQFDYDDVIGRDFQYRGHRLMAGAQYTLPWGGIRLKYDFDGHLRDYVFASSFLPSTDPGSTRRQDEEMTNTFRAEIPLFSLTPGFRRCPASGPGSADCVAWVLSAEYQRTDAASNIAVFDYTRNVFSLILSLTY